MCWSERQITLVNNTKRTEGLASDLCGKLFRYSVLHAINKLKYLKLLSHIGHNKCLHAALPEICNKNCPVCKNRNIPPTCQKLQKFHYRYDATRVRSNSIYVIYLLTKDNYKNGRWHFLFSFWPFDIIN